MGDQGKLLIIESIVPETLGQPSPSTPMDLLMSLTTGGRERTGHEYCSLLQASGFGSADIRNLMHGVGLIEVMPASD